MGIQMHGLVPVTKQATSSDLITSKLEQSMQSLQIYSKYPEKTSLV